MKKGRKCTGVMPLIFAAVLIVALAVSCSSKEKTAVENHNDTKQVGTAEDGETVQGYSNDTSETAETLDTADTVSHDTPNITDLTYPFNTMSADWDGDDLDGWWHYELPEDYVRTGGSLPDIVQVYTYCLCAQHGIDYPMVLAMIEAESGYKYNAAGPDGGIGYMQVIYKWHSGRMENMVESDLYNPYINISVALDYLKELSDRFETMEEVLTTYNYGVTGAYRNFWNEGVKDSPYSDRVLEIRDEIIAALEKRKAEMTGDVISQETKVAADVG